MTSIDANAKNAARCIARGDALYQHGRFDEAYGSFLEAAALRPDEPDLHFRLGSTAWKLNRKTIVAAHYLRAIELDPSFAQAHQMLAQWLVSQGRAEQALAHSGRACELAPENDDARITHAVTLSSVGNPDEAYRLLKPLLEAGRLSWHLASAYADVAVRMGRGDAAVRVIDQTLRQVTIAPQLARRLHVSAASLLLAGERYDEAFSQMRQAKALVSDTFDASAYSQWVTRNLAYFTREHLRALPRATRPPVGVTLIVGMPRSGTTLVEQILSRHPRVKAGGELRALGQLQQSLPNQPWANGLGYPECLEAFSIRSANALAEQYAMAMDGMGQETLIFTDKMPHNFEHLGLAELILGQARIIHCQRDPRDTCLSCLMTDFNEGNAFSCDPTRLASYYRDYQRQMAHWKGALSLPMIRVQYERLVSDAPGEIRRLLNFLGLPWDERCLTFHESTREVATASREQVRQPLYSSSIGRWKTFEKHLGPILDLTQED